METADGKKRTFKGSIAEDIAYQINLKEKSKEAPKVESKVEPKAEQVVEKPVQVVKPVVEIKKEVKPTEVVEPIRQLGTGANVYFENNKYRVNDNSKGKVLLNIEGKEEGGMAIANIEFDSPKEAVEVAKELAKIYPSGVPDAVLINKVVDDIRNKIKVKPTEVKEKPKTKIEEIKAKIKSKLESFKERFTPVKKTSTQGEKIAEAKDVYKKVKKWMLPLTASK